MIYFKEHIDNRLLSWFILGYQLLSDVIRYQAKYYLEETVVVAAVAFAALPAAVDVYTS